jgi:hypothetical protein
MVLTGNSTVDALITTAEALRQQTCNAAGASQATQNAAYVTYYKSVISAKLAASPSLDIGNEISAIQDQLNSSV